MRGDYAPGEGWARFSAKRLLRAIHFVQVRLHDDVSWEQDAAGVEDLEPVALDLPSGATGTVSLEPVGDKAFSCFGIVVDVACLVVAAPSEPVQTWTCNEDLVGPTRDRASR